MDGDRDTQAPQKQVFSRASVRVVGHVVHVSHAGAG
ncbi:MAG: hypothetical protein ACI8QZ_003538, partial [Chlamydiales bacterium]